MLVPPLGDSGLAGKQGTKILERDPLGKQRQDGRSNG